MKDSYAMFYYQNIKPLSASDNKSCFLLGLRSWWISAFRSHLGFTALWPLKSMIISVSWTPLSITPLLPSMIIKKMMSGVFLTLFVVSVCFPRKLASLNLCLTFWIEVIIDIKGLFKKWVFCLWVMLIGILVFEWIGV